MKYCTHCGAEMMDEAVICVKCGCEVASAKKEKEDKTTMHTIIKVFLIISCVVNAISGLLIPLAWCLPMTLSILRSFKEGRPVGMGMKICTLLFISIIPGILLLCLNDD